MRGRQGAREPAQLSQLFEAAWNAHDMEAFALLFEPDALFVSRFGHVWLGRQDIVARHADIHKTIYRKCQIANRVLREERLGMGSALVLVRSRVSVGDFMTDGPREFSSMFSYVARERDVWRIQAGINVAVADPNTGVPSLEHAH